MHSLTHNLHSFQNLSIIMAILAVYKVTRYCNSLHFKHAYVGMQDIRRFCAREKAVQR